MNAVSPESRDITPSDRLGMTLFVAVVVHAVFILGVTFSPELTRLPQMQSPPIEIRLVHQRSEDAPQEAEYLAQVDSEGGGTLDRDQSPQSPAFVPLEPQQPGLDVEVRLATSPEEETEPEETLPLTQDQAERAVDGADPSPDTERAPLTADELIARSLEIASLSAEINQSMDEYAQRGRHRWVSPQTMAFRDAAYLDAWRAKVERIGNLNYPDEAKRRNLSGRLLLDVAIRADGSLHSVELLRSSGHRVLDEAALRIVRLAAPFAEFPEDMKTDTDVLHITRTWEFLDSQLRSQ